MATASEKRAQAAAYMKSRKKKNNYTQKAKRVYFFGYPDNKPGNTTQKGYSDCSAAARAAIKAVTGVDIGANTSAQINNRNKKGVVVHETTGFYPDESKLKIGDCLYFKGNTSHPLDVGHVEMYTGPNECTGHGGGIGPTVKNLKTYCKGRATKKRRYFMAIRWIKDDAPAADTPTARTVRITGDCWARTAPNTSGKKLGVAKKGKTFAYQGVTADNGWNLIEFNNQNAWVSGKYSKLED